MARGGRSAERQILATSGGFVVDRPGTLRSGPLIAHALALCGRSEPNLCYLNTATGDDATYRSMVYAALARDHPEVRPSHLAFFPMPNVDDPRAHLLAQDVIWVGGGSVVNLLAVWRAHGIDEVMRDAWTSGVVLAGASAGSLCWHAGGTTDSFGPTLRLVDDGLRLLPFSNTPHFENEAERRPLYTKLVQSGVLPAGYATDDGVGLHYRGRTLVEAVADRPNAYAWKVERGGRGKPKITRIVPRLLTGATAS